MPEDPKSPVKTMIGWLPNAQDQLRPPQGAPQAPPAWDQPAQQPYGVAPNPQQPMSPQGYAPQQSPHGYAQPQSYAAPPAAAPQSYGQVPQGYGYSQQQGYAPQDYAQPHGYAQPQQPQAYAPPQGYAPQQPQGYAQPQPYAPPAHAGYGYPQAPPALVQSVRGYGGGQAAAAAVSDPRIERPIANADATAGVSDRVRFIRQTYVHLLGAVLAFAGLLYLLMTNATLGEKVSAPIVNFALGGRFHWAIVLGVFVAVSWVADYWARSATSRGMQYAGLGLYVVAEALIFLPLLVIVQIRTYDILARGGHDPHILRDAAFTTLAIFGALTASVFISRKDFSWMRSGLVMMTAAAMMLIVLSLMFGFNLGIVFSIAMVVLAAGYILYQTSQVLAHYDPQQHVAAALALFSSLALMFWYVIRIFLRMRQ